MRIQHYGWQNICVPLAAWSTGVSFWAFTGSTVTINRTVRRFTILKIVLSTDSSYELTSRVVKMTFAFRYCTILKFVHEIQARDIFYSLDSFQYLYIVN